MIELPYRSAPAHRRSHRSRQKTGFSERQIETLAGDRVKRVGRIAYQQIPCPILFRRQQPDQWPLTALADGSNGTQSPAKSRLKRLNKSRVL